EVTLLASRSRYGEPGAAFPAEEVREGIRIVRVAAGRFGNGSVGVRSLDSVRFLMAACRAALRLPRPDLCLCLTTPPFVALVGRLLRLVRGTPYVVWAMDLYPDVPVALGVLRRDHWGTALLHRLDRALLRGAARVVVLGRCMQARVVAKGVPQAAVRHIPIWAHQAPPSAEGTSAEHYRDAWGAGERFVVMYAGNFGLVHDLDTVADAVQRLVGRPDILFAFVGGGPRKAPLLAQLRGAGVTNWIEAGYQPPERLDALLRAADLHLATMLPGFEGLLVPSKVPGALDAGRPVAYVGGAHGEAARLVREHDAGVVVATGDGAGLAAAIARYADDRAAARRAGAAGAAAVSGVWSAPAALQAWVALAESVAAGAPATVPDELAMPAAASR
ncbi:MAG: glycosyltransferase family 4 protein, partial [Gemmatimonadetes bacterium]|nr:glycosyltransferase family 4 protein [Gemmatimonadota bacterium]